MKMPSKYKLTGDAKRLWEMLVEEFGTVLKERHKPLLFAMCQQWELYQKYHAKLKRNRDEKKEWTLHCSMSGSLKQFKSLSDKFAMGINDELQFTVGGTMPTAVPKDQKAESRLANLLSKIGGSEN